jgi:hypothetical protein
MTPELLSDLLLGALLIATIAAVWRLERRLNAARAGQAVLAQSALELSQAAQRAEAAIQGLRATAEGCGADLDQRIKRARVLADELALLADRAAKPLPAASRPAAAAPSVYGALSGAR